MTTMFNICIIFYIDPYSLFFNLDKKIAKRGNISPSPILVLTKTVFEGTQFLKKKVLEPQTYDWYHLFCIVVFFVKH